MPRGQRLVSLEWEAAAFRAEGHRWSVVLTTPALAPSYLPALRNGTAIAVTHYAERRIWIDAGFPGEFDDTLLHEIFHVFNPVSGEGDHKFFARTLPLVCDVYSQLGINLLPPLPLGWERLARASRRLHREMEDR